MSRDLLAGMLCRWWKKPVSWEVTEKAALKTGIMRQPGPPQSKNGFEFLWAYGKSPKVSVLEADPLQRWHDNIIFYEFITPAAGPRLFLKILPYPPLITRILQRHEA
jgi:hypothetical protein